MRGYADPCAYTRARVHAACSSEWFRARASPRFCRFVSHRRSFRSFLSFLLSFESQPLANIQFYKKTPSNSQQNNSQSCVCTTIFVPFSFESRSSQFYKNPSALYYIPCVYTVFTYLCIFPSTRNSCNLTKALSEVREERSFRVRGTIFISLDSSPYDRCNALQQKYNFTKIYLF